MAKNTIKNWKLYLITVAAMIPAAARGGQPSFIALGDLPGGLYRSLPRAVSGDGTTVVGLSWTSGPEAFVWRAGTMTSLNPVPGWFLVNANSVSWDGSVIVGSGYQIAYAKGLHFLCAQFEHEDPDALMLQDRILQISISLLRL